MGSNYSHDFFFPNQPKNVNLEHSIVVDGKIYILRSKSLTRIESFLFNNISKYKELDNTPDGYFFSNIFVNNKTIYCIANGGVNNQTIVYRIENDQIVPIFNKKDIGFIYFQTKINRMWVEFILRKTKQKFIP